MADNRCPHCGRNLARPCLDCPLSPGRVAEAAPARDRAQRKRELRARARGDRVCPVCGQPFTPPRSDAVTCSPKCRQKAYRARKPA